MDGFADGAVERHGSIWVTDVVVKEFSLNFEKVQNFNFENFFGVIGLILQSSLTSCLTASTFSMCLLKMCFLTNSGPLNFFPLRGQRYLFSLIFSVFISMNLSTSVRQPAVKDETTYVRIKNNVTEYYHAEK